ncbi:MAG TPA: SDR family NAD(P)-dependent oxidoreductase [Puia sp.]|jgi:uncharacterized oxidoreductase|nr:SDR family NAD(P)-dependent oxidoreductase [Puia sp.]
MKSTNNKILIIGGSAGIGFEIAKLFSTDNRVIITGRNEQRLQQAAGKLKNVTTVVSDVSDAIDVQKLVELLYAEHPDLNIVVNNAGKAFVYNLAADGADGFDKASQEIQTNFLSIIRLNEKLLPLLRRQPEAAIVNVTSIVAIAPGARLPTYAASKAALHSYTLSLRHLLAGTSVKVFELLPPLVDTEFSTAIDGHKGIKPVVVAEALLRGLEADNLEIRVGQTEELYRLYLSSPEQAFAAINNRK